MTLNLQNNFKQLAKIFLSLVVFIFLFILSEYDYVSYHTIIEFFSIIVAFSIFIIIWNSREFISKNPFILISLAYLIIGFLDLFHLMTFPGTGMLPDFDENTSIQFWISARYLEGISLLLATYFFKYQIDIKEKTVITGYLMTGLFLSFLVFLGYFPQCYITDSGLTNFKIISEYIIVVILIISIYILQTTQDTHSLPKEELTISLIFTILMEISFTLYSKNITNDFNFIGHIFKLISFYYIYKAFIEKVLKFEFNYVIEEYTSSQNQLVATSSLLSTFFHDLKNPLSIIRALSQLGDLKTREDVSHKYFRKINRETIVLTQLLNNALLSSQPQQLMLIDPYQPLQEVFEKIKPLCQLNKIKLTLVNNNPKKVMLEINLFKRAVSNLLRNAIDVLNDDGEICISIDSSEKNVKIIIKDNGPGLPKEIQNNIFKPFKKSEQGSGLGLYMTYYTITKIHQGHITFKTSPGNGTSFYITLPVHQRT